MRESLGSTKPKGAMKVKAYVGELTQDRLLLARGRALRARHVLLVAVAEPERTRWDPKDGELCLSRVKPEETLVEARSGSDVQIDRQTWV